MVEDKQKIIYTSTVMWENNLYEQYYNPKTKEAGYVALSTDKKEIIKYEDLDDLFVKYLPIQDELLEKGAVILPTEPKEYGDVETLDKEINDFIYKYVDITDTHRQHATWYVRLSWVLDNVHTVPYLRALGDYGSGKTRYEDAIGGICYKPTYIGGSVRSAPIYRSIDLWRGTAIFDEFTLSRTDETMDIVQILNCGFQRGKPVLRCKDGNYSQVECFDPFGAKILASKKEFDDKALESRCITEIIQETDRNDIPIDLGETFLKERAELQNKLLMYRLRNWDKIKPDETKTYEFGHIQPRIKQTFLPFTVLFSTDELTLKNFVETVKKHNTMLVEENSTTYLGMIVNAFMDMKEYDPNCNITSQDLRNELVNKHNFKDTLTSAQVGKKLKPIGFTSKPKKVEGKTQRVIIINPEKLKKLIYRYVLPEKQDSFLTVVNKIDTDIQQTFDEVAEVDSEC